MKTIVVDMDGVLCSEMPTFERSLAEPLPGAAAGLLALKGSGYRVVIYTARGWQEYDMTYRWLKNHDMVFDVLMCGKPIADLWIDDRAISFTSWSSINVSA